MIESPVCLPERVLGEAGDPEGRVGWPTTIWQRLKRFLLSEKGRKIQICIDLLVTSIYWAMRRVYNQQYNDSSIEPGQRRRPSVSHSKWNSRKTMPAANQDWIWRGWPELGPWPTRYRLFSCAWMVYVLIKNVFRDELAMLIKLVFNPRLPANCYLPGRFSIADEVQRVTAIIFAFFHLLWRYIQFEKHNRLDMSIVYFLLLDDRDILKYYSRLSHPAPSRQRRPRGQHSNSVEMLRLPLGSRQRLPHVPMDSRERMMHDIMSYRVDYKEGEVFRLRPNRTPEACARLRNSLASSTLLRVSILTLNVIVIFALCTKIAVQARNALINYPGCNPRLEQAVGEGQMDERRVYLQEHVPYTVLWDLIENWVLWFDSGCVCYLAPGFIFIFNYDLMIYWAHLHDKIGYVYRVVHQINHDQCSYRQGRQVALASRHELELWLDELVLDLQMEIQDMIKQIKQADCFLTDATSSFLVIWFSLFAFFIYKSVTAREGSLPLALLLTLLLMAAVVTVVYASLLTLHGRIHKSYPLICSLMAHDRSKYKRNFISILDYFAHNRTCYTVFRLKRMTSTSYLTIVGWSFSCYFLLSKV